MYAHKDISHKARRPVLRKTLDVLQCRFTTDGVSIFGTCFERITHSICPYSQRNFASSAIIKCHVLNYRMFHCTFALDFAHACRRLDCDLRLNENKKEQSRNFSAGVSLEKPEQLLKLLQLTLTLLFILHYLNADATMRLGGFTLLLWPKLYPVWQTSKERCNSQNVSISSFFFYFRQILSNILPV